MFNIRLFSTATTVLVAALTVQVAEAQPRGTADIVWQHVSGQVHYWPMQGGQRTGGINNFTTPRAGSHAGHDSSAGRYTFDATDAVQRLSLDAAAQPSLVFEPTTGLTDSSSEAAAAQISPQANVRFDSARLVIVP